jgi:hypothetical protein
MDNLVLSRGLKRPGRKAHYTLPPCATVKNAWNSRYASPQADMERCYNNQSINFPSPAAPTTASYQSYRSQASKYQRCV